MSKMCSEKFRKIHKKTPVSEFLFSKIEDLQPTTLLKKKLQSRFLYKSLIMLIMIMAILIFEVSAL